MNTRKNMSKKTGRAEVTVIVLDSPLTINCRTCGRNIITKKQGYLLGITINEDNRTYKYFLGTGYAPVCCGLTQSSPIHFETTNKAEEEVDKTIEFLNLHNSTEGLNLLSFVRHN